MPRAGAPLAAVCHAPACRHCHAACAAIPARTFACSCGPPPCAPLLDRPPTLATTARRSTWSRCRAACLAQVRRWAAGGPAAALRHPHPFRLPPAAAPSRLRSCCLLLTARFPSSPSCSHCSRCPLLLRSLNLSGGMNSSVMSRVVLYCHPPLCSLIACSGHLRGVPGSRWGAHRHPCGEASDERR